MAQSPLEQKPKYDPDSEQVGREQNQIYIFAISAPSSNHPNRNEDAMFMNSGKGIFGVFDGMGGSPAGDKASQIARNTVSESLQELSIELALHQVQDAVYLALIKANQAVYEQGRADDNDMGTTASIGVVWNGMRGERKAIIGNVGDSRVYLFRNEKLEQITLDDNLVISNSSNEQDARMTQAKLSNVINPENELNKNEKSLFYHRNQITQFLGLISMKPKIIVIDLLLNDKLLVCTDGISDNLTDGEIQVLLNSNLDTNVAVQKLIEASQVRSKSNHARRKTDDMTALVVKVGGNEETRNNL